MKLWYDRKSKNPTYFIQQGFRNGKKTTTKNIARIGKHSELLTITDDPLAYAKEQVAAYNEKAKKNNKVIMEVEFDFSEKLKSNNNLVSSSNILNVGYFYLQQIYYDLNISSFFKKATSDSKITFDPNLINRFLTYARILEPDSKLGTYYEKPDFKYIHILRTMDILSKHYDAYINHLFEQSCHMVRRNTAICFYDCSNYYFETESEDEDYLDEVTGESLKDLRKYAVSKEHRPNPVVPMGLFMDADGIPLSMCITSGSDKEQTTAIPLEKKLLTMFHGKKFIYCADAGLGSFHIRNFNSMGGRAFIVTQSVKKLSDKLKKAVFNDCDYRLLSDNTPTTLKFMKNFDKKDIHNQDVYKDKAYKILTADSVFDVGLYEEKQLKNMNVVNIEDMCYLSTYDNSQVCTALNALYNLGLDKKYYQPKELNKKIKKISR